MQKAKEYDQPLYMCFTDFHKAFLYQKFKHSEQFTELSCD